MKQTFQEISRVFQQVLKYSAIWTNNDSGRLGRLSAYSKSGSSPIVWLTALSDGELLPAWKPYQIELLTKALFTWRQGAPANRATRLEGLEHSPPLHATHLSEIVGRAAANHNKEDGGQQKRFGGKFNVCYHSFR